MSHDPDVAAVLGQVVAIGPTAQEVDLGAAVARHVSARPAPKRADGETAAALRALATIEGEAARGPSMVAASPSPAVVPVLQDYLAERMALGVRRYGAPLIAGAGRDFLVDAFEEAVDLACYLAKGLIERDGHLPRSPDT